MAKTERPLVIRRVTEEAAHGHHGGAWKVAYADFVTAMMAFFLLLWLISSANQTTLRGLAQYFSDSAMNKGKPGGVGGLLDGITITQDVVVSAPQSPFNTDPTLPYRRDEQPETDSQDLSFASGQGQDVADDLGSDAGDMTQGQRERQKAQEVAEVGAALREALKGSADLRGFAGNLQVLRTPEGVRIQILDRDSNSMFPTGSDRMYPPARKLLETVVKAVATMPGRISIRGHTDALPFAKGATYDNWSLSADRADATRRVMLEAGLDPARLAEIVGRGDAEPFIKENPADPRNRRISIVLLDEPGPAATKPGGR